MRLTLVMRHVLVLGGTNWLGREIAARLVRHGDAVTCLARGTNAGAPSGATLVAVDRTAPGAYDAVATRRWDEVVELSYLPTLVGPALEALGPLAEHWTLVSSVSVYATGTEAGADESAPIVEPVDLADYGQAKAWAELASVTALGDRLLIVRPGLIAGPGDPSDRFGYWVGRLALAGAEPVLAPVPVPGPAAAAVQVVDVRDLADWIEFAARNGLAGCVNVVGHTHSLADTLALAAKVAHFTGRFAQAGDEWLADHGVSYWAGPRSLPLWLPPDEVGFARRSNAAFLAAGGSLRELEDTMVDVLADEKTRGLDRVRRSGLSRAEEVALLGLLPEQRQTVHLEA